MIDIKLKDLRYLVAVADTHHFGKAAERCFVSQPTLSAQLRKLEDYLGVQLLERQPGGAVLTAAGADIVARARRILEASEEVVTIAQTHRDPLAGRLRVAFLPTIGPYLLPLVVPTLRKVLPRLEVLLFEYRTATMLEKLHAAEIDLGVLALPVELDGLVSRRLYDEEFTVALPQRHRLNSRETLKIGDLKDESLLLLEEGHCLRDQALDVCSTTRLHEKQDFRATSLETLRQMVAAGAGVTLMPKLATRGAWGGAGGVVIRPLAKPVPSREIGAIWRKSTARGVAIQAFCDLVIRQVP